MYKRYHGVSVEHAVEAVLGAGGALNKTASSLFLFLIFRHRATPFHQQWQTREDIGPGPRLPRANRPPQTPQVPGMCISLLFFHPHSVFFAVFMVSNVVLSDSFVRNHDATFQACSGTKTPSMARRIVVLTVFYSFKKLIHLVWLLESSLSSFWGASFSILFEQD